MHLVFFILHHLFYSSAPTVTCCCWKCSALPLITFQSFTLDMKRKLLKACLIQQKSPGKGLVGGQENARSLGRGLYFSWKQWLQAHLGQRACSTLPHMGPAPSDLAAAKLGLQPCRVATLDWSCGFVQMKEQAETLPWSDGCMAEGDRSLMLDVTLGKTGKEGELKFSFRIHSPVEQLYAFNEIHMCIRPHAFSMYSKFDDFKAQIHGACEVP